MNYAIICDARKGWKLGVETLAYVDRRLTKKLWWTSDYSFLIMEYNKRSVAEFFCKKLYRNNARVVDYKTAVNLINEQDKEITHFEALVASEAGWDGHKDTF